MNPWVVYGIIIAVIIILVVAFRLLKKRVTNKMSAQKEMVNQHKMTTSIFVISKQKDKLANANLPKSVKAQVPKVYKLKKLPLVTAKVGPQVITLVCEDDVFNKIPEKKNIRVDIAGIFIVGIKPNKSNKSKSKRK